MTDSPIDWKHWLPTGIRHTGEDWQVDWCRFGRDAALREPFFNDSVAVAMRSPFNQAFGRTTPLAMLCDWQRRSPGLPPTAFVFHVSRCGSTLLAQMLARLDSHIVLSEPPPLDALLRAHYEHPVTASQQARWISALLSAYGQRRRGTERALVIKLDAWNLFELPQLRTLYPDVPCLFLYRDPHEVVASHLRSPGRHTVPGLIGKTPLAWADDGTAARSRPAHVARIVGRLLDAGWRACRQHGAIPVNYLELPHALGDRLAAPLGVRPDDLATIAEAGGWHAKRPGEPFVADGAAKRDELAGDAREAVAQWASPAYRALEALRLGTRSAARRADDEPQILG